MCIRDRALDFGFEVLKIADIANPNRELVSTYNLIGQILTNKKLFAEALSYFSEALKSYPLVPRDQIVEKKVNSPPWVLVNISNLYYAIGDFENAKQNANEAKKNFLLFDNEKNKQLGLNPEIVNVNGGAIALGHPVGATGAIIMTKLVYELRKRKGKYGLATMCIGGGQGIAVIIEAL